MICFNQFYWPETSHTQVNAGSFQVLASTTFIIFCSKVVKWTDDGAKNEK